MDDDDVAALREALDRVRSIHSNNGDWCEHCYDRDGFHRDWPCPTIAAIDRKRG